MKVISQRLIFQAERILNPPSNFILGHSRYSCADATPTERGKGIFNIPLIPIADRKTKITHIYSSVSANTSEISKQVSPNVDLGIYSMKSNNLSLFEDFSDEQLIDCNLSVNGDSLNHGNLNKTELRETSYSKIADNIIAFDAVSDPVSPNNNELLFFPYRLGNNKPSIINKLTHIYSLAYDSNTQVNAGIELPSQTKYIVIMPFVSIPIPPSRFRVSIGKISVSILLNLILEDE